MTGKFIQAKFNSKCAETGKTIRKGERIFYAFDSKQAFCSTSTAFSSAHETESTAEFIQSQEDAYFDNFCQNNNI